MEGAGGREGERGRGGGGREKGGERQERRTLLAALGATLFFVLLVVLGSSYTVLYSLHLPHSDPLMRDQGTLPIIMWT
mgnify:CR=1 FL=1